MNKKKLFIYTFDVSKENEEKFKNYMKNYGLPVMSKYCLNWEFYVKSNELRGKQIPQYIGYFEIEDIDLFLDTKPTKEMQEIIKKSSSICSNINEWIAVKQN